MFAKCSLRQGDFSPNWPELDKGRPEGIDKIRGDTANAVQDRKMSDFLTPSQAREFYDGFGARQDRQGFYEDAALAELCQNCEIDKARNVFEFGCGTGRFASLLLCKHLSPDARFSACDISENMVALAQDRLGKFSTRSLIWQCDHTVDFEPGKPPFDLIVSSYVLDLLPPDGIWDMLAEAARCLSAGGRLGLVSLTDGRQGFSWLTSRIWATVQHLRPNLVGGCRPVRLAEYLDPKIWRITHQRVVVQWTVPSEVIVAVRR